MNRSTTTTLGKEESGRCRKVLKKSQCMDFSSAGTRKRGRSRVSRVSTVFIITWKVVINSKYGETRFFPPTCWNTFKLLEYHWIVEYINVFYYSFKIFNSFWLVKTTRIIHHNQLLLTKFGKNFIILHRWRQNDIKSTA